MPNTNDLRFVRTEGAIRTAFLDLVAEEPVASITAVEVCKRAGISRNAFYLHHSGVTALYAALIDELLEDVRAECVASAERVSFTGTTDTELVPAMFSVLLRHESLLRALLPSDDGSLVKRLAEGLESVFVEAALVFGEHGGSLNHRLRCAFSAWASLGLLQRWLELADQPLTDLLPYLSNLQEGIQVDATLFLTKADNL